MTGLPAPERFRRVAPILEQALECAPEERAALLDRACGGDAALRAEVEALLRADAEAVTFLNAPVDPGSFDASPGSLPDDPGAPLSGTAIGPYRIVREIGRGGMGVVYEAEQQNPRRAVALKVILGGRHVDAETVRLFRRESDSLARLRHPGIAAIHESGSTPEGQHFFAMELVPGRTLGAFLDAAGPPASRQEVRRRLALFRKIAAAVAYAHQRGVIHRDLKPANILVIEPEDPPHTGGDGVPDIKILDFGLARIIDADASEETAVTAMGRVRGTLPYMSPEQVRGRRDEIDVRTDVYALGVILYRMLTGGLPLDLQGVPFPEAVRVVCEVQPRPLRAARLRFDEDLEVLVARSLEKEASRRYQSVGAFDEDVARYLAGQPILARAPSAAYQLRRLVARHKAAVSALAAILVLLVGFAAAMTLQARRIARERDRANREAASSERVASFMTGLFRDSDPYAGSRQSLTARALLDRGLDRLGRDLSEEPAIRARLMASLGTVYSDLGDYPKSLELLRAALDIQRRLLGEDHPDTLATMQSLATTEDLAGRRPEAEAVSRQVIALRGRVLGPEHKDTLDATVELALIMAHQSRFPEAERMAARAADLLRRNLGGDDPTTMRAETAQVFILLEMGRYAETETRGRTLLDAKRRVLGEDHPETMATARILAEALYCLRRFQDALDLETTTLATARRVFGDDQHFVFGLLKNVAKAEAALGHLDRAEAIDRDLAVRMPRVLGEDHPETMENLNVLAMVLDEQGRYREAEAILRPLLEHERRILGEDHDMTLNVMNNLANEVSMQGRYAEADALFQAVLEKDRRVLGEDHPHAVQTRYNLACTAALRGDRAASLRWLDEAVAHGYDRPQNMTNDSDLKSLHGDAAFAAIVERARANEARAHRP